MRRASLPRCRYDLPTKELFIGMLAGTAGATDVLLSSDRKVSGSRLDLVRFFRLFDEAEGKFPIVTR